MSEWVSVKNRLPENETYVLASDKSDVYILKFYQSQDKRFKNPRYYFESSGEDEFFDLITHWMPLPKPPFD